MLSVDVPIRGGRRALASGAGIADAGTDQRVARSPSVLRPDRIQLAPATETRTTRHGSRPAF
jgi:hypothetical protein